MWVGLEWMILPGVVCMGCSKACGGVVRMLGNMAGMSNIWWVIHTGGIGKDRGGYDVHKVFCDWHERTLGTGTVV